MPIRGKPAGRLASHRHGRLPQVASSDGYRYFGRLMPSGGVHTSLRLSRAQKARGRARAPSRGPALEAARHPLLAASRRYADAPVYHGTPAASGVLDARGRLRAHQVAELTADGGSGLASSASVDREPSLNLSVAPGRRRDQSFSLRGLQLDGDPGAGDPPEAAAGVVGGSPDSRFPRYGCRRPNCP